MCMFQFDSLVFSHSYIYLYLHFIDNRKKRIIRFVLSKVHNNQNNFNIQICQFKIVICIA